MSQVVVSFFSALPLLVEERKASFFLLSIWPFALSPTFARFLRLEALSCLKRPFLLAVAQSWLSTQAQQIHACMLRMSGAGDGGMCAAAAFVSFRPDVS